MSGILVHISDCLQLVTDLFDWASKKKIGIAVWNLEEVLYERIVTSLHPRANNLTPVPSSSYKYRNATLHPL